jgi:hypothetical protein
MPSEWETWSIPFVGGVDTKTDGKLLQPPKLTILENGVFVKHGTVRHRAGYDATSPVEIDGTPISDPAGLANHGDELVLAAGSRLFSYDDTTDRWLEAGPLEYVTTDQVNLASTNSAQQFADVCTHNGVTVAAWQDSRGGVYASAYSTTTGAPFVTDLLIDVNGACPALCVVDGVAMLFWYNTSSFDIKALRIPPTEVATAMMATAVIVRANASTTIAAWDVVSLGATAALAYATDVAGQEVHLAIVDQAGQATSAFTISNTGLPVTAVAICASATNIYTAVSLTASGSTSHIDVGVWPISAPGVGAAVREETSVPSTVRVAIATSGASARYYWQESAVEAYNHVVKWSLIGGTASTIRHSKLASAAWGHGDYTFVHVLQQSTLQSTYFMVRSDGHLCGRFNYGLAGDQASHPRLPKVQDLGDDQYGVALRTKRKLDIATTSTGSDKYTHDNFKRTIHTFGAPDTFHAVESGGSTYISGSLLWQYDGGAPVEAGFLLFPENGSSDYEIAGTPVIPNGATHQYRVYYEWTTASGERERSSAVQFQTINAEGASARNRIVIPTLAHTLKQGVRSDVAIVIYRSESLGSSLFRCSSPDPTTEGAANGWVTNDHSVDSVEFVDNMTDTTLRTKEPDYQNSGEFDNTAPDSGTVLARSASRLFLAGGCIPNNTVLHSKVRGTAQPAAEFNGNLVIRVDEEGGPVTALAELNGTLIVFKRDRIYAVEGEGPNDVGGGQGFGTPRLIASDVGCSKPRTVALTPAGLMFVSARGIYLLNPSQGVVYIGAPVENFNEQDFTATVVVPGQNIVVFLSSDGKTLMFDYLIGEWGAWTNHTGVGCILWRGNTLAYVDADCRVLRQNQSLFTDGGVPYPLHFRLAPVRPPGSGVQGNWRLRRSSVLGKYLSSHVLVMGLYYDRDDFPTEIVTFTPDSVLNLDTWGETGELWGETGAYWGGTGSTEYQFELRTKRQKCETVSFDFYDIPGTPAGAGFELTELALEWAPKTGLTKQPATRKV